ncbi:TIGR02594 family protein [Novosphingobium sp. Chol11]|uniref:NlpC/P60 family protein n=1 Tax=Novosphingobium sp. Chol11 TaxID=1385763 RepID=UPI0025DDD920|nr:TIGR02594 family protein [Novosphingobium sp. Chol11]
MTIREIQEALAGAGYLPGPIDGAWGRQTAAAVRAFQKDRQLTVDGVVGPQTLAALNALTAGVSPAASTRAPLVWLAEAKRLLGTTEKPGAENNPTIINWAEGIGEAMYNADDIPWCGLFVGHCIGATLPQEALPSNVLRARAWERFGHPIAPTLGSVMVFWRRKESSGLGHVGFYVGQDDASNTYCILGGNQSNSVSFAWIDKSRFVGARWPATFTPSLMGPTQLAMGTEVISVNEA